MFLIDGYIWTALHFIALGGLSLYGIHRLWLLACWRREDRKRAPAIDTSFLSGQAGQKLPVVTVQLPLYNERFVAERLLNAVACLYWPKERLEIQILDDSTDDTRKIVDEKSDYWRKKGIDVKVLRRGNREGYKAGALNYGLTLARGEYLAVFDADFLPCPDFLHRTLPFFSDKKIGMAQARWGFLNAGHSWLTGIQSLLLGPHFSIEHWVRCRRGLFFNFNGTAGIWRRKAIESAGGWQYDTVTEDLDLSYRAQLAGWRFVYLDDLVIPSELPVTMASFRSQQQRWAKGSVQTARKILPRIFSSTLPTPVKAEALAHLLANFGWLLGAIVTLTLYPAIIQRVGIGPYQLLRLDVPLFMGTSLAIFLYFLAYKNKQKGEVPFTRLLLLPVLSIGMAPSIALAVLEGFFSRGGVFKRTPKFGIKAGERLPGRSFLYRQRSFSYLIINTIFFAYCILPIVFACRRQTWIAVPFLAIFPLGFLLVILKDLKELRT
jgi:cellulose synthase/poly-beta-1,6-N-acetylglucosamine synthase-like glycosyltransferase